MIHEPEGRDPTIQSRGILFEADVQSITPFLKLARISHNGACDEGPNPGGLGSAPTPLMYVSVALAF
jgi:hypothetical protein